MRGSCDLVDKQMLPSV